MEDSNLDSDPRRGKDRFLLDQKSELFYEEWEVPDKLETYSENLH